MARTPQYFLPDVDPTIAVAQAARFEGTGGFSVPPTRSLQANNRLTPLICMSVMLLLIVVGWVVKSPSTTSTDYAFAENVPASR
jgi:hypothetical protein